MKLHDEDVIEVLVNQRNSAYREVAELQRALDNERRAHSYTRLRYDDLLNSMAKHAAMFANPPVVIVNKSDLPTGMHVSMREVGKL